MVHPVNSMTPPLITTPSDAQASPSMCQKALRMLRSSLAPCCNRSAMLKLAAKVRAAIAMIQPPSTGMGCSSRLSPMIVMPRAVSNRMNEFKNAAMMPAR